MTIKGINIAMGASYGAYSQKLTQATKQELVDLGIPFDANITEKEGKALIAAHNAQNKKNAQQENFTQSNQNNQSELLEKAKKLAQKVGVAFPEEIEVKQLLALIQEKLEEKITASENNPNELKNLKNLSYELSSIQAQCSGSMGYDNTNQALLKSLELLGQYNKNQLLK